MFVDSEGDAMKQKLFWPSVAPLLFCVTATAPLQNQQLFVGLSFSATGIMTAARSNHTATLLPTRKVLIAGGQTPFSAGSYLSTAELYDPRSGGFTATSGQMTAARYDHTATLLPRMGRCSSPVARRLWARIQPSYTTPLRILSRLLNRAWPLSGPITPRRFCRMERCL